jgi:hypothetical protein
MANTSREAAGIAIATSEANAVGLWVSAGSM